MVASEQALAFGNQPEAAIKIEEHESCDTKVKIEPADDT